MARIDCGQHAYAGRRRADVRARCTARRAAFHVVEVAAVAGSARRPGVRLAGSCAHRHRRCGTWPSQPYWCRQRTLSASAGSAGHDRAAVPQCPEVLGRIEAEGGQRPPNDRPRVHRRSVLQGPAHSPRGPAHPPARASTIGATSASSAVEVGHDDDTHDVGDARRHVVGLEACVPGSTSGAGDLETGPASGYRPVATGVGRAHHSRSPVGSISAEAAISRASVPLPTGRTWGTSR